MSTTLPLNIREHFANAIGRFPDEIPDDADGLIDLVCPALGEYTNTHRALIADCDALGIPTIDADGPLSLYQMIGAIARQRRLAAEACAADLAEVHSRLTAAGYVPAPGETTGDLVARALRDTREADDKREAAEAEAESLLRKYHDEHAHAADLAEQLHHAAGMIARMSATISRMTR